MPPWLKPGTIIADRFRLERELGQGGMGTVWAATHTVTRKRVALKILKGAPSALKFQRFRREAQLACAVDHPNVVAIHDVLLASDGAPVMVMDLLQGESLGARLAREGTIALGELAALMLPVLDALGLAHAAAIIHRDLKPDNLFLHRLRDGRVELRVLDFGIAKLAHGALREELGGPETQTGSILGTPFYMSPELAAGEKNVSARADIWALGAILYECLAGRRAIDGENFGQVFRAITGGHITPLGELAPELPRDILDLVASMLAVAPSARLAEVSGAREVLARHAPVELFDMREPAGRRTSSPRRAHTPSVALAPTAYTPRPATRALLRRRNPHFTGRAALLEALEQTLDAGKPAGFALVLRGLGGSGKSEIALEYAHRSLERYTGVIWLRAEDPAALSADYASLAPALGTRESEELAATVEGVRQALSEHHHLLVFDNAVGPGELEPFLPRGERARVLITSRAQSWPGAEVKDVGAFEPAEGASFLLARTGQSDRASAQRISALLGELPLALEQAAAYVETRAKPLDEYARLLEQHGLVVLERGKPHNSAQTIGTTWALALAELQSSPGARELLTLSAFLAPEGIDLEGLSRASTQLDGSRDSAVVETLGLVLGDELARDDAKAALLRYSLISAQGETITVHRLLQEVVKNGLGADTRQEYLGAARRLLRALLDCDCEDVRNWALCRRWVPHARAVTATLQPTDSAVDAGLSLLESCGDYFVGRGLYAEAERTYRRGLDCAEKLGDRAHVAALANGLALALKSSDRTADAEPLYRRALACVEAALGPEHPRLVQVANNLGVLLMDTGRLSEAEPLYRRALSLAEAGGDARELARLSGNLAILLHKQRRTADAEPLYRRALALDEATFGPDHPRVAIRASNLAVLSSALGRSDEAEALLRRALLIDEAALGSAHRNVGIRLAHLGNVLEARGSAAEARACTSRALAIFEAALGPDHSRTKKARLDLARLEHDQDPQARERSSA